MVILFCGIGIKIYIAKIKKYNELLLQKQLEQQKAVRAAVLETQDQSLNDIAQELHDDTGQRLTYLNLQIERLKLENPTMEDLLKPVTGTVSELATQVRSLSHGLTSSSLTHTTFYDAVQREMERINKLQVLHADVSISNDYQESFSQEERIIHYRVFQEIINNCLKHAQASKFTLHLAMHNGRTKCSYHDDGSGMDASAVIEAGGMQQIRDRAELINYVATIESIPGTGTTIVLIPNPLP